MKFTQNSPVVTPNTIGNARVQVSRDPMAYGTAGKDFDAFAGAIGQVTKVVQQQQDDMDAADHMNRRNNIMTNITKKLYGEDGLLTNGIGENAKGLTDRVQQVVKEEFDNGLKGANARVRRSMAGTFNENMGNYLRIASQQEGREYTKVKDADYAANQNILLDQAIAGYADGDSVSFAVNQSMNLLNYRAKDQGWSNLQLESEKRKMVGQFAGGAIQAAMDAGDLTQADILYNTYGPQMDQSVAMKYQKALRKEKQIVDEKNEIDDLIKTTLNANGEPDWNKIEEIIKDRAKQTKEIGGGGGSFFADSSLNDEIMAAAKEFNVDPALVAAVADVESNGNQNAVSSVGALGVMQLMPDTAASLGVDPHDRKQNIRGGAKYLRQMLDTFGGDVQKAVAAYNAGPGAVKDYGGVPPYKETQNYVAKILGEGGTYSKYKKAAAGGGGNFDKGYNSIVGQKMDYGEVGCVEAVVKGGKAAGIPFFEKQQAANVVDCDTLKTNAAAAGIAVENYDPNNPPRKGDVIIYDRGERQHAVTADGNGGYWGNSSSQGIVVHGRDYNEMGGKVPTQVIRTGSLGGGGGSSRTVNVHDSGYEDRMIKRLEVARSDWKRRKADSDNLRLEGYQTQIQQAGSATNALSILERIKSTEKDPAIYSKVIQTARTYYPDAFKETNSITGTRRSRSSGRGTKGLVKDDIIQKVSNSIELGYKLTPSMISTIDKWKAQNLSDEDNAVINSALDGITDYLDAGHDIGELYNELKSKYGATNAAIIVSRVDNYYINAWNKDKYRGESDDE